MMSQPDVEFKDIKLDGWDEIVKIQLKMSFNLPEEKVSLDNAARVINTYTKAYLGAYGYYHVPYYDIYGYCGFQAEEIQLS